MDGADVPSRSDHPTDPDASVIGRLQAQPDFRTAMASRMHPGMMLVVSDLAAHPDRQTGADFVIMASDCRRRGAAAGPARRCDRGGSGVGTVEPA